MMKLTVTILATLAAVSSSIAYKLPSSGSGELAKDLQDFVDLIPFQYIRVLTKTYLEKDKEVQTTLKLLESVNSKLLIKYVESAPEITHLLRYAENAGLDLYRVLNELNRAIGIKPIAPRDASSRAVISGGLDGFLSDIQALMPHDELSELFQQKLTTSKVFADWVAEITSPEMIKFASALPENKQFARLMERAKKAGIDSEILKRNIVPLFIAKTIVEY